MKKMVSSSISLAVFTVIFLVSCASPVAPTLVSTSTITPGPLSTVTYTSQPSPAATRIATATITVSPTPVPLEVMLFFDMNGSGLQDEATFQYDPTRLVDEKQPLQPDLLATLSNYVQMHPELKKGNLITIEEPALSGYKVCADDICGTTDKEGKFTISNPTSSALTLKITDPNAGTPALEMRYINKWNGPVVIPAYEMNGVQVPEQHLNDTEIVPIKKGVSVKTNQVNEIGLMQGFLTLPLPPEAFINVHHVLGFDHDPRKGYVINYAGDTQRCLESPLCNAISASLLNTNINKYAGIWDSHVAYDFMFPRDKDKYSILATIPGNFSTWECNGLCSSVKTDLDSVFGPEVVNGEIYMNFVEQGQKVYRGQIIGLSGSAEYAVEHPELKWFVPANGANYEMSLLLGPQNPKEPDDYKPNSYEKDPYGVTDPNVPLNFPDLEVYSSWTVFNSPLQPMGNWDVK